MKVLTQVFGIIHGFMALPFACAALMLIVIASRMGWLAFARSLGGAAALAD